MNVFIEYQGEDRVLLGEVPYGYSCCPADPPDSDDEWGNWSDYIDIILMN